MGNETSVPDSGTTPEELAAAADALSGTSPTLKSGAGVAASASPAPGGGGTSGSSGGNASTLASSSATSMPTIQTGHPQQQLGAAPGGMAPLGAAEGLQTPTSTATSSTAATATAEKAKAMQQQMKAKAAAMKAKGMTSAKSMFQRTGIGGGGGGGGGSGSGGQQAQQAQHAQHAQHAGESSASHPLNVYQNSNGTHTHPALHHQQQTEAAAVVPVHHGRTTSALLPGQGGKGAVVDVMYATESHHSHHHHEQQQQQQQQQHLVTPTAAATASAAYHGTHAAAVGTAMPATAAADALSRQMQDMTLSNAAVQPPTSTMTTTMMTSAPHGAVSPPSSTAVAPTAATGAAGPGFKTSGLSTDEDEWQHAWEDDESSGEEEDEEDDDGGAVGGPGAGAGIGGTAVASSSGPLVAGGQGISSSAMMAGGPPGAPLQPFRLGMDGGHSSSLGGPIHHVGPQGKVVQQVHQAQQVQQIQQVQQQQQPIGTKLPQHMAPPPPPRGTMAVLPPGPVGGGTVITPDVPDDSTTGKQAGRSSLLDGLVWDTQVPPGALTPAESTDSMDERPSEKMFFSMRVLGKGSFGKVVLVQKRTGKERGGLFAMKILRKTHLVKRRQIERTKTERKVLALVDHPFIMKLHYAFQSEDKLYLVLDYCPGGELFFHLSRYRRFPERVARFYAAELLLALGHLHKKGIIYRDLKPENVLLDADGHVKLGDFGLAKDKIVHPCQGATSMCGTPEYMAPEVLSQAGHGFCVDYWGLGMLTYEMMTGLPPWYTTDRSKLFRRLKSAPLDIPTYFSMQSASAVSALLERNPRKRMGVFGIKSAMQHEFFREIDWRSLRDRRIDSPIRPCEGWKANQQMNGSNSINPAAGGSSTGHGNSGQSAQLTQNDLDVATANFDQTFTRMALETEDRGNEGNASGEDGEAEEQLNENTFVGFTFHEHDDGRAPIRDGGRTRGGPQPSSSAYASRR